MRIPSDRGSATLEFTLLASFSTIVFGLCLTLTLVVLTKAHAQSALSQSAREQFYLGANYSTAESKVSQASELQTRLERRLSGWPFPIRVRTVSVQTLSIESLDFAIVTADFAPLNLDLPALKLRETTLVVIEDA